MPDDNDDTKYYDCAPDDGTERFDPNSAERVDVTLEEWIREQGLRQ